MFQFPLIISDTVDRRAYHQYSGSTSLSVELLGDYFDHRRKLGIFNIKSYAKFFLFLLFHLLFGNEKIIVTINRFLGGLK